MMTRRDFREKAETMGWTKVRAGYLWDFHVLLTEGVTDANARHMPGLYFVPPIFSFGAVVWVEGHACVQASGRVWQDGWTGLSKETPVW